MATYHVGRHGSCGKPFAVIRNSDGKKMGCFSSRKSAEAQIGQLETRRGMRKETDILKSAFDNSEEDRAEAMLLALEQEEELEDEGADENPQKSLSTRFFDYLSSVTEKAAIKRENGLDYPARDFAFVPDPSAPSTWKLRLTESPGKITAAQLGRAAAAFSAGGFRGNRVDIPASAVSAVKRRIRAEYRRLGIEEGKIPNAVKETNRFNLWKEADGTYRWFAVYSNAFRDDDRTPEIISKESHELFVSMVDTGMVDMPELWHYHIPGTRWGVADWVGFSDGFALASGTVDKGHEGEAEALAEMDGVGVSHGMLNKWILRDETDPTIITMHVTSEISPLPLSAAANKLTTFFVKENEEMPLSKQKRDHLLNVGYSEAQIDALEGNLKETADAALAAGIESKETTQEEDVAAEPVAVEASEATDAEETTEPESEVMDADADAETDEQPSDAAKSVTEPALTRTEIADAIKAVGELFGARFEAIERAVTTLATDVKSLKEDDATKIAKAAEATPAMSLQEMLTGMFSKEATVDGRTALSKQKPAEAKEDVPAVTGIDFIDSLFVKPQV